jgi:hypothetical protein
MEKGLIAIKLMKLALATNPEIILDDESKKEIKMAWTMCRKLLTVEEMAAFKEMLKNYGKEDK